jgi:hypothetical protein
MEITEFQTKGGAYVATPIGLVPKELENDFCRFGGFKRNENNDWSIISEPVDIDSDNGITTKWICQKYYNMKHLCESMGVYGETIPLDKARQILNTYRHRSRSGFTQADLNRITL